jgi:L-lactate dehydrogenase complex protein LldG
VSIPFPALEHFTGPIFNKNLGSLAEQYAVEFTHLGGRFVYCDNNQDMLEKLLMLSDNLNWNKIAVRDPQLISLFGESKMSIVHPDHDINESNAAISLCERLVARTGSAVYSSAQSYGRELPIYAHIHITVAYTSQLVYDWREAQESILDKYDGKLPSVLSLTTGPSRTADIEKTLVVGVHGPREVYTFLVEG